MKEVGLEEKQKIIKDNRRLTEFPIPSYEEWKEKAEKSLYGASFEEKLVTGTYEGISLKPMYTEVDLEGVTFLSSMPGKTPYVRGTKIGTEEKPWEVSQELLYSTPEDFNLAAQNDLKRGQTMLNLVLDRASAFGIDPDQAHPENVGSGGVSISSIEDISTAFEGIDLEQTPLLVQAGCTGLAVYSMVIGEAKMRGMEISKLRGCIGMDPLGTLVKEGTLPFSLQTAYNLMA
jgi:methylmalonyl-CoA mutase